MKEVRVSVPGKVILMGDHAVVYGYPGLFASTNLRMSITVRPKEARKQKNDSRVDIHADGETAYINQCVGLVASHVRISHLPYMSLTVQSDIPVGYHLGSSAAVAAGTIGALLFFLKNIWNPDLINKLAYEAEKLQHKTPSGIDNTAVVYGGFGWYRKELEFLKSVWQLPIRSSRFLSHLYLIDTGKPHESTGEMVEMVSKRMIRYPKLMTTVFRQNEEQVRRIAIAIKTDDEKIFVDAMNKGQRTLEKMGVTSKYVLPVIKDIVQYKGASKILGGGGRTKGVGYLLCYHPDKQSIEHICAGRGFSFRPIHIGGDGIRLEEK